VTAGIPGAGIGGVFYILTSLFAPLRTTVRWLRGDRPSKREWHLSMRHASLASTILAAIWLCGWLLGAVLITRNPVTYAQGGIAGALTSSIISVAMVYLTVGTLLGVVIGVEVLRLLVGRRGFLTKVGLASSTES
jgi:hypothetical protein